MQRFKNHGSIKKKSVFFLIIIIGVEKKSGMKKLLEEIMAANFPNLAKYINLQIQKAKQTLPE